MGHTTSFFWRQPHRIYDEWRSGCARQNPKQRTWRSDSAPNRIAIRNSAPQLIAPLLAQRSRRYRAPPNNELFNRIGRKRWYASKDYGFDPPLTLFLEL